MTSVRKGDCWAELYPGTIEVLGSTDLVDEYDEVIDTVTLIPENADDYEFVERENDYTMLLLCVGNSYAPQMDNFSKEAV